MRLPAGLRIKWDAGCGSTIMAGPGSAAIPGVGLLIIMDAGIWAPMAGPGGLALCMVRITGSRLWSDSSDGAPA
jgi:hypothetical protein